MARDVVWGWRGVVGEPKVGKEWIELDTDRLR